jgi:hypothetical protein
MRATSIVIAACLLAGGCEASGPGKARPARMTYPDMMSQATPDNWRRARAWVFEFVDQQQRDMGSMTLLFTAEAVDDDSCADRHWKRARILADRLDFDFGFDLYPAYTISGPWLTIDLTSSICSVDHNLIGELSDDGASGHFTVSHSIGGENVGTFRARAADGAGAQVSRKEP